MILKLASATACAVWVAMLPLAVQAFAAAPFPSDEPVVTLVADGCRKGNHRNNAGQCVNGPRERSSGRLPAFVHPELASAIVEVVADVMIENAHHYAPRPAWAPGSIRTGRTTRIPIFS
jgi:hypothetical protein